MVYQVNVRYFRKISYQYPIEIRMQSVHVTTYLEMLKESRHRRNPIEKGKKTNCESENVR